MSLVKNIYNFFKSSPFHLKVKLFNYVNILLMSNEDLFDNLHSPGQYNQLKLSSYCVIVILSNEIKNTTFDICENQCKRCKSCPRNYHYY